VVGFIDLEFRQRLNFSTPQAWVPDLVVTETSRSRGAGKALREAAFKSYVADPYDGAAPSAIVSALARLKRGELLSPASMTSPSPGM